MKVLDSKILIKSKRDGLVEKIGGFEVPVGAGEYAVAEVVAVGDKIDDTVRPGDTVYYYQNAGKELTIDGEKYRVITSSEVCKSLICLLPISLIAKIIMTYKIKVRISDTAIYKTTFKFKY